MNTDQLSKEIMSDIERDKLFQFSEDKIMFESVKKYLLYYLYQGVAKPGEKLEANRNYALQLAFGRQGEVYHDGKIVAFTPRTDEELGKDIRTIARGIQIIESGFKEIGEMKRPETKKEDEGNPAL